MVESRDWRIGEFPGVVSALLHSPSGGRVAAHFASARLPVNTSFLGKRSIETRMILSAHEIKRRLGHGIAIEPFDESRLNPVSYNLALHDEMLVYEEVVLDAATPNRYRRIEIPSCGFTLQPGQLYLGRTVEHTETRGLVPMLKSRSSIGRLGLFVMPGGSLGHAGYCGTWTLEMHCVQPVRIYPGMQICQICYMEIVGELPECDGGKYQHSRDIQPSLLYRELGGETGDQQLELNFDAMVRGSVRS